MIQIFSICQDFNPKEVDATLVKTRAHDIVYGAYTYEFRTKKGRLYISVMGNKLHEVLYDYPKFFSWTRKKRNRFLLNAYCEGEWKPVFKNETGHLFQSIDNQCFAAWSKENDTMAFGTVMFYEEKCRIVT